MSVEYFLDSKSTRSTKIAAHLKNGKRRYLTARRKGGDGSDWTRSLSGGGLEVPQFRDGECEVRVLWDEAVAEAMGWDRAELARLRRLLHQEPHVRGLGYNQYADEAEDG